MFAKEVIAGAPRYGSVIAERVGPVLRNDVRTFERWAREGRIARVNFTHLMFIIWSVTQAYADQQAQFALLLGKPALTERDYAHAEALICHMVLAGLAPNSAPRPEAPAGRSAPRQRSRPHRLDFRVPRSHGAPARPAPPAHCRHALTAMATKSSVSLIVFGIAVVAAVLAIYLPGWDHALLFDDLALTDGTIFGSYGNLLAFKQRLLSYGSFVWVDGLAGAGWWKQRLVNIALHLGTVAALYALVRDLLTHTRFPRNSRPSRISPHPGSPPCAWAWRSSPSTPWRSMRWPTSCSAPSSWPRSSRCWRAGASCAACRAAGPPGMQAPSWPMRLRCCRRSMR